MSKFLYTTSRSKDTKVDNVIYLKLDSLVNYILSDKKAEDVVKAKKYNDGSIYVTDSGEFVLETGTEYYLIVDEVEINLFKDDVEKILENYQIEDDIKADLIKESQKAKEQKNELARATAYLPKRVLSRGWNTPYYYTYKGYNMKDSELYVQDAVRYSFQSGSNTFSIDSNLSSMIVYVGGKLSSTISIVDEGISVLQMFLNLTKMSSGNIYASSSDNYSDIKVTYNYYKKYKYAQNSFGDYKLGSITSKSYLKYADFDQYYMNKATYTGIRKQWREDYFTWYTSANYENSSSSNDIAIDWALGSASSYSENNTLKLRGVIYDLSN